MENGGIININITNMKKNILTSDETNIMNILTIINDIMFSNIPLPINNKIIKDIKDYIEELKIALDDRIIELLTKLVDNIIKLRTNITNTSFVPMGVIKGVKTTNNINN